MNIKTNPLKEYVNFVDTTKKQNKNFKSIKLFIAIIIALLLFFVFFLNVQMNNTFSEDQIQKNRLSQC